MYNAILVFAIVTVLVIGGFLFLRGFPPSAQNSAAPQALTQPLVPVAITKQQSQTQPQEKKYYDTIDIESRSFFFAPDTFRVKRGQKVTVNVRAFGDHTFTIDEFKVNVKTPTGKVTKVEFTPQKAGAFQYYCKLPGHKEAGQVGILIVE